MYALPKMPFKWATPENFNSKNGVTLLLCCLQSQITAFCWCYSKWNIQKVGIQLGTILSHSGVKMR